MFKGFALTVWNGIPQEIKSQLRMRLCLRGQYLKATATNKKGERNESLLIFIERTNITWLHIKQLPSEQLELKLWEVLADRDVVLGQGTIQPENLIETLQTKVATIC
jgi:hypothetical protein